MWSVITRWLAASIHPQTKRAAAARLSSAAPVSCPLNRSPRGPLASALVTIIAALPLGTEMTSSLIALPLGKTDPHVAPSQTGEPGLYEAFYQSPVSGINKVQVADSPAHPQTRPPTNTLTHKHAHPTPDLHLLSILTAARRVPLSLLLKSVVSLQHTPTPLASLRAKFPCIHVAS